MQSMRDELTKRMFLGCMTVFLVTFTAILTVMNVYLSQKTMDELRDRAVMLSSALNLYGDKFLLNLDIGSERITLIDKDGTVLFDSVFSADNLENHAGREEIQEAFQKGEGESRRYSESAGTKTANYAVKLTNGQIIRISMKQEAAVGVVITMISAVSLIVLLIILLSVVLATESSRKIMIPINQLDPETPDDRNIYVEMKPFILQLISQNQKIHQQIEQLQQEHKKQDDMRREFTANVSHELKTPLTSISGFAEIIREGYVQQQDVAHFADNIYKEAQRMISLVNDILRLSRLESDEISQPPMTEINLSALCQTIRERLTLTAEKQNISLICEGENVYISGVPQILEEVIYNLCDNAIKYNHEGGFVYMKTWQEENYSFVQIKDTGIGIPEQAQERIFERFYRVSESRSKEIGGTGLGLSIVKHGVLAHQGEISLESEEQKGTCITLRFPAIKKTRCENGGFSDGTTSTPRIRGEKLLRGKPSVK